MCVARLQAATLARAATTSTRDGRGTVCGVEPPGRPRRRGDVAGVARAHPRASRRARRRRQPDASHPKRRFTVEERLRRKGVDVDAAKSPTRDDEDADADEYAATSAFVTRGDVPRGEDVCERVSELAFRQDAEGWPAQKTEAWKFARASALTASDVARVLEGGDARGKVLRQKQRVRKEEESMRQKQIVRKQEESSMTPSTETKRDARRERRRRAPTSAAIRHGNEFEAEALAHYERTHGTTCLTFGLKIHDDHYWLGASPDGVHPSGRVVEIKCPYSRAVVPRARAMEHYAQIQTSLEVFDLEFCDFVQYKPPGRGKGRSGDPDRAEYLVETVPRNREWFARAFDELRAFALALPSP